MFYGAAELSTTGSLRKVCDRMCVCYIHTYIFYCYFKAGKARTQPVNKI